MEPAMVKVVVVEAVAAEEDETRAEARSPEPGIVIIGGVGIRIGVGRVVAGIAGAGELARWRHLIAVCGHALEIARIIALLQARRCVGTGIDTARATDNETT